MIKAITDGISAALYAEFGDAYAIYTEEVEQGLQEPCFFLSCIEPTCREFFGKRYFRENPFCIQYFPADKSGEREECNEVSERLFSALEYITVTGDLLRGTRMHTAFSDGVLSFFVNYDLFVYQFYPDKEKRDAMDGISASIAVKG